MKKLILFILVLFSISTISVFAEEPIVKVPTEEINEATEVGLFEGVIVGIFDFVTSEEFTKLSTSIGAILLALYPFLRKYLTAKGQAKYNSLTNDLMNWKQKADQYETLTLKYAAIADNALKQVEAVKDSLVIGFDKSNLRQDVKDKIMTKLNSVPKLDLHNLEEPTKESESINTYEEKDNLLTEAIENTELPKVGW